MDHVVDKIVAAAQFQSIATAVQLKEAIEKAPSTLKPIGDCKHYVYEYTGYPDGYPNNSSDVSNGEDSNSNEEDSDSNEEDSDSNEEAAVASLVPSATEILTSRLDQFDKLPYAVYGAKGTASSLFNTFNLKITIDGKVVHDKPLCNALEPALMEELVTKMPPATYGDMNELSTKVNPKVRQGIDLTTECFSVPDELCRWVEQQWGNCGFLPTRVRAEPYKINIYGPGGHFALHQDTPTKNLVGTFLIGLADCEDGGKLTVFKSVADSREIHEYMASSKKWKHAVPETYMAFYTDRPHVLSQVKKGYRANLSFKIYADPVESTVAQNADFINKFTISQQQLFHQLADEFLMAAHNGPLGLILSHDYSLNSDQLKGKDALVYHIIKSSGRYNLMMIPVIIHLVGDDGGDWDPIRATAKVFPMTGAHLAYMASDCDTTKEPDFPDLNLKFIYMNEGYTWSKHQRPFIEHVGNECQSGDIDAIYLHRALIAIPKE